MTLSIRHQAALWAIISAILAVGCGALLRSNQWSPAVRWLLSVGPVLPMAWYCWLALRVLRQLDELEVRIQLEGAVYGLLGTALLTMTAGLLMKGGVVPALTLGQAWPWLWISAFLLWAAGSRIAGRRYR
jgi:hypothetical protein